MKHHSTDRGAMLLALIILALLWFLYGRMGLAGNVDTGAIGAVNLDANVDTNADSDTLPARYAYLQKNDYTNTTSVEDFGSNDIVTRATSTPFLARYGFISELEEKSTTQECTFPDVVNKSDDLQKTITVACAYDLLRGSNGNFMPDRVMSKDELLTVLVRTKTGYLAEDTSPWFKNYFDRAQTNGLVDDSMSVTDFSGEVTKADLGQRLYKLSLLK